MRISYLYKIFIQLFCIFMYIREKIVRRKHAPEYVLVMQVIQSHEGMSSQQPCHQNVRLSEQENIGRNANAVNVKTGSFNINCIITLQKSTSI